jgi:hypothetical protein
MYKDLTDQIARDLDCYSLAQVLQSISRPCSLVFHEKDLSVLQPRMETGSNTASLHTNPGSLHIWHWRCGSRSFLIVMQVRESLMKAQIAVNSELIISSLACSSCSCTYFQRGTQLLKAQLTAPEPSRQRNRRSPSVRLSKERSPSLRQAHALVLVASISSSSRVQCMSSSGPELLLWLTRIELHLLSTDWRGGSFNGKNLDVLSTGRSSKEQSLGLLSLISSLSEQASLSPEGMSST